MFGNNPYQQSNPFGNIQQMMQRFQQFRQQFQGDPQQQIQQMLQSGRISQGQYEQAVNLAKQLQGLFK
jgi:hypothetical protein